MNQTKGIKLLALMIAIIMWAYVRVTVGGVAQNSITQLELRIPLETKLGSSNFIAFERSTDTISLTLRGDSEVVTELREGLVRAYVELEGMAPGSNWPEVQVLVPAGVQILKIDPRSVNVQLSPLMVKEVPVKIETAGAPRGGFKVGSPVFSPQSIKLEGPEELVRQVSLVSGVVPVDGLGETLALTVNNLVPLNENGTAVMGTDTALKLAVREVRATIPIEQERTLETLPVLTGNIKVDEQAGYDYSSLEVSPQYVQVSTTLPASDLPAGLQLVPTTLKPNGGELLEVQVEIEPVAKINFVGAKKVTVSLKPKRVATDNESED